MPKPNSKLKSRKPITGLHILGEIYTNEIKKLDSPETARKYISRIIKKFELHELGSFYYRFPKNGGFTGLVSLVESHIAIHTWPELNYLTLDVYLCNYSKDNSETCKNVFKGISRFFNPTRATKVIVMR